jgi:rare lipoprotein A
MSPAFASEGKYMITTSVRNHSCLGVDLIQTIYPRRAGSGSRRGHAFQLLGLGLMAGMLAACAQTSTGSFTSSTTSHRASLESHDRKLFASRGAGAGHAKEEAHADKRAKEQGASVGLASFYAEGSETASGERFNANELTAAHRTLPFGTRVRVTNRSNGRSVVVTINDRGPFVSGRIIDVTPAGARALGMSGVASVSIERE